MDDGDNKLNFFEDKLDFNIIMFVVFSCIFIGGSGLFLIFS